MDFIRQIAGHSLEYIDEDHLYLVDGITVPSITQMLHYKFPEKYRFVPDGTLQDAADKGTAVHEAIQSYCETGEESTLRELRNFRFLMDHYRFDVLRNEVPVILFYDGKPVGAGRLDMVLRMNGEIGGADVKRTSALDKDYLFYQLNLYRIAYRQSYGEEWKFLKGIWLREDKRKFIDLPINEELTNQFIKEFLQNGYG